MGTPHPRHGSPGPSACIMGRQCPAPCSGLRTAQCPHPRAKCPFVSLLHPLCVYLPLHPPPPTLQGPSFGRMEKLGPWDGREIQGSGQTSSGNGHWLCVSKHLENTHSSSLRDVWRCPEIFLIVIIWGCKTNPRQWRIRWCKKWCWGWETPPYPAWLPRSPLVSNADAFWSPRAAQMSWGRIEWCWRRSESSSPAGSDGHLVLPEFLFLRKPKTLD